MTSRFGLGVCWIVVTCGQCSQLYYVPPDTPAPHRCALCRALPKSTKTHDNKAKAAGAR